MKVGKNQKKKWITGFMMSLLLAALVCQGAAGAESSQTSGDASHLYAKTDRVEAAATKASTEKKEKEEKEEAGGWLDDLLKQASGLVRTVGDTVDNAKKTVTDAVESWKKKAQKAASDAADAVDSLKKGTQKTASDAADAVDSLKKGAQKTASDAADAVDSLKKGAQKTASDAADAVDSLKKGAQKTASDAADAVDSLKKGAQKTASDAADALQKGSDEASKKIEEIVNKILETYKWYSEKWDQVLAYLKEKIAETDITENEWRVLRLGFDRAVRNAYNAGWLGKESWYTISRRADTVFETLRHVYRMAKEELTPAEFRREMVDLLIKNEAPEIISSLIAEKTGMDKETAEQIVGMVLVGVRQYLKEI